MFENVLVKNRPVEDYEKIVIDTFFHGAVRTALLIDDEFPTLAEFLENREETLNKYKQAARAVRLYKMFKSQRILCDVENDISRLKSVDGIDRIRKSDLIVLDYHLNGETNPADDCIEIILKLADTPHFNVVVVLTNADVTDVWLDLASNLRGGWRSEKKLSESQLVTWAEIEDVKPDSVNKELLTEWVLGDKNALESNSAKQLQQDFKSIGVSSDDCIAFIENTVINTLTSGLLATAWDRKQHKLSGACSASGAKWLFCDNIFVAIVKKPAENMLGSTDDPENILNGLMAALTAWQPNIIQIILSEVQNKLEMGAFASDEILLGGQSLQTGVIHYVLSNISPTAKLNSKDDVRPAMELLIGKLMEGLRRRIDQSASLTNLAAQILATKITSSQWASIPDGPTERKRRSGELLKLARKLVGDAKVGEITDGDIIFELNAFLSTQKFYQGHLTTGTIFRQKDGNNNLWWVCMSPACDMTMRQPSKDQIWHYGLHPFRGMVAVSLEAIPNFGKGFPSDTDGKALKKLKEAEFGRHIYLDSREGYYCFRVSTNHNHPLWEFMILENAGSVNFDAANGTFFSAKRMLAVKDNGKNPPDDRTVELTRVKLEVMGQLRSEYASRFLQAIGTHLSRIGVDYSDLPQ